MTKSSSWFLHQIIAQSHQQRLDCIKKNPKKIILAGVDGNHFYSLLKTRYPKAEFYEIDDDQQKLNEQKKFRKSHKKLFEKNAKIQQIHQSFKQANLIKSDFLFANLTLMRLPEEEHKNLLTAWFESLNQEGMLFFSTLGRDSLLEIYKILHKKKISISDFPDLHYWGDLLVNQGFKDPVIDTEKFNVSYQNIQTFWQDMATIGIQWKNKEIYCAIEHAFLSGSLKNITLEIVHGHAIKPLDNQEVPIHFYPKNSDLTR